MQLEPGGIYFANAVIFIKRESFIISNVEKKQLLSEKIIM